MRLLAFIRWAVPLVAVGAVAIVVTAVIAPAPADALAGTSRSAGGTAIRAVTPKPRRIGGRVRPAWPATGRAPRVAQARWLAHQVGATKPKPCARDRRKARVRCHLKRTTIAALKGASSVGASPHGEPAVITTRAVAATPLQLVRSYDIPADDPAYRRLLNWSWTYDSAVAAAAFASAGDERNAGQLLDQLAALQYTDGSIEIAFNTATREGARVFRAGTVAWLGLAAATYDRAFRSTRYLANQVRAAGYLLSLQGESGLIAGGPDVRWISTQHNLVAYVFLARLAAELRTAGDAASAARYQTAATAISAGIDAQLLVVDAAGVRFRQGVADDTQAVDVQILGALYLQGTRRQDLAVRALAGAEATFARDKRTVTRSADLGSFNLTYASGKRYSGYAPYVGVGAPDVIWAEASGEMALAQAAVGQDPGKLLDAIAKWGDITGDAGPLQADQTVTGAAHGLEYHVWPASAAAAWALLARAAPAFFAAPLPVATTLVSDWTAVRGGNLIKTRPDGSVDMVIPGGERRVLAARPTAADYTVTATATLVAGAGYGIYVRATTDSGTKLTGYCIQLDRSFGQVVVRQLESDSELSPLARATPPAEFAWFDVPHVIAITVAGNAMTVRLDGVQLIALPDLAVASAAAVKSSSGVKSPFTPPTVGGYGLRSWGDGVVRLQQLTSGPPA